MESLLDKNRSWFDLPRWTVIVKERINTRRAMVVLLVAVRCVDWMQNQRHGA
jgi:hypothetical protein